jgi:hypothetical protein
MWINFYLKHFYDYFISIGINVEHHVTHIHTQNGLVKSFIKRLQLIARHLLMKSKQHVYAWRHAIFHVTLLVEFNHQIFFIFAFLVMLYITITPPQYTKIRPQRRFGVSVGFDSPSIIRYLEHLTGEPNPTVKLSLSQLDSNTAPRKCEQ